MAQKLNLEFNNDISEQKNTREPPVVDISRLHQLPVANPEFKVEALLPAKAVTLLGGHGGTGKSQLALLAAVCAAAGRPFLDKHCKRSRVILYSCEDSEDIIRHRLHRIVSRMSINPADLEKWLTIYDMTDTDPILYRGSTREGEDTWRYQWLKKQIEFLSADVIIIDNASDVFDADENSRPRVREFIRKLRQLVLQRDGAVLLLAHVDKSAAKSNKTSEGYSGSTAWNNSVRSRLYLSQSNRIDQLNLEHQKSNWGRKSPPICLEFVDGLLDLVPEGRRTDLIETNRRYLPTILYLIQEYHERGETIGPAQNSPVNAYKMLSNENTYPKALTRSDLFTLLRYAQREGLIERESFRNNNRKEQFRWRVTTQGGKLFKANKAFQEIEQ